MYNYIRYTTPMSGCGISGLYAWSVYKTVT